MMRNFLPSVSHAGLLLVASWSASFVLESAATAQCEPAIAGSASTPAHARNVAVSGTTAYVVDFNQEFPDQGASRLNVIDVSDPATPMSLASLQMPGEWVSDVAVSGTTVYVVDSAGLHIIDASKPTNPTILGSVRSPSGSAVGVTVSGTTAYVAADFGGLIVVDVSDPVNPEILGSVATDDSYAWAVSVSGDRAYMSGYSFLPSSSGWLQVIDISDSTNPVILGSLEIVRPAYGNDVAGTIAYVTVHFNTYTGLQLVDVSDPANPTPLGWADTANGAWSVRVSGATAYVADGHSGLQAINVSDPANPTNYGSVDLSGYAWGVAVSGNSAYVAANDSGLQVLDVQTCIVPGACCVNGVAVQLTASECAAVGGVFHGSGVPSEDVECTAGPCPGDMVTSKTFQPPPDGVVDGADLAYLLGAWGTCR